MDAWLPAGAAYGFGVLACWGNSASTTRQEIFSMARRKTLPANIQDHVMREFNHLCAICGNPRPQIHHIDCNHSNNDELNLIPLCPNHHLIDAHSPTKPISPLKLHLFRKHRDPVILLSQFDPLFQRMLFLLTLDQQPQDAHRIASQSGDLIDFVSHLNVGPYYSKQLRKCIGWIEPLKRAGDFDTQNLIRNALSDIKTSETARQRYIERVLEQKDKAIKLIIEVIRFQDWKFTNPYET
ncbi:HNH endonuclease signature motif containing protein [uncultured Thiodictyon sp.]|uniref:HNH endonuclease signature motif containing protein n=1 Tax=uncultured Thiodictyon sp. TaxID=1846217 RepID=UPI0025EAF3CB|nr:HNH endonuclease signature motif containing protein [uncultured Thiodictyon sp.]